MTIRDLIPWNRGRDVAVQRGENANPLLTLHREMNRVFDDVLRGFDVTPFGSDRLFDRTLGWPNIEISEHAAATAIHPGRAAAKRSRTSSTPGSVAMARMASARNTTSPTRRRVMRPGCVATSSSLPA